MLDENKLSEQGFLDPHLVRSSWMEHLRGTHNWEAYIWEVLMFQSWLEQQ
jgi:asparagine synthase (glutamine-hydrolysing)